MTADVELLPLPAIERWEVTGDYAFPTATDPEGHAVDYDAHVEAMQSYARACVAHATAAKDAEIEALRAEVKEARRIAIEHADARAFADDRANMAEARSERLAEALIAWHKQATDKGRREREESPGHSHAVLGVWDSDNGKYAGVDCAQFALWFEATRLRAALHPTAAQENDDA